MKLIGGITLTVKKVKFLPLNLQFFADEPPTDPPGGNEPPTDPPAFSIEDVLKNPEFEKFLQSRDDKIRTEYSKKNSALQKQLDDEKKSKMTEQEKLDAAQAEIDRQTKELQQEKNKFFSVNALSNAEMPASFLDFVLGDTDEQTTEKIQTLKTEFDKAVAAKVEETFKGSGRKYQRGAEGGTITKEQFNKLGYNERAKLAADNPELYQQLSQVD